MAAKRNVIEENSPSPKMQSKIIANNNMIKYEKISEKELVAAYMIMGYRYYETIEEDIDVKWKGNMDYEEGSNQ